MDDEQIYSNEFKHWFGDWQKQQRIDRLRSSECVEITGEEVPSGQDS